MLQKLFLDDGERPTTGCHLADDIMAVLAAIEEQETLGHRVCHCLENEYTLHDPLLPFTYITPKSGRILPPASHQLACDNQL
jgi:hypothetical protein